MVTKEQQLQTILQAALPASTIYTHLQGNITPSVKIEEFMPPTSTAYTLDKIYTLTIRASSEASLESIVNTLLKLDSRHPSTVYGFHTVATIDQYASYVNTAGVLSDETANILLSGGDSIESILRFTLPITMPAGVTITRAMFSTYNIIGAWAGGTYFTFYTYDGTANATGLTNVSQLGDNKGICILGIEEFIDFPNLYEADGATSAPFTLIAALQGLIDDATWDRTAILTKMATDATLNHYLHLTDTKVDFWWTATGYPYHLETLANSPPFVSEAVWKQTILVRARWTNP